MMLNIQYVEGNVTLVKTALQNHLQGDGIVKMQVPELPFNGTWSAIDLKNFLWDMEPYFKAT